MQQVTKWKETPRRCSSHCNTAHIARLAATSPNTPGTRPRVAKRATTNDPKAKASSVLLINRHDSAVEGTLILRML